MMSKRIKFVLTSASAITLSYAIYDSYRCVQRLRKPLSTKFLSRRCEFIYIPRDFFREPVKDFLNEFFREETRIYSFLYNLKRTLTFTKVTKAEQPETLKTRVHHNFLLARICLEVSQSCETFNESFSET